MTNQELHAEAMRLLVARKAAQGKAKDYNQRRKDATADLRPIFTQIHEAIVVRHETVAGCSTMKDWAKQVGITTRWIESVIAGPKAKSLRTVTLKEEMTVKIEGYTYIIAGYDLRTLTVSLKPIQATAHTSEIRTPAFATAKKPKAKKRTTKKRKDVRETAQETTTSSILTTTPRRQHDTR